LESEGIQTVYVAVVLSHTARSEVKPHIVQTVYVAAVLSHTARSEVKPNIAK